MRTHEYAEAASERMLDAAVRRIPMRLPAVEAVALMDHTAAAVADLFCPCITDLEDAIEGRLSEIHAALIAEVARRARLILVARVKAGTPGTEA